VWSYCRAVSKSTDYYLLISHKPSQT